MLEKRVRVAAAVFVLAFVSHSEPTQRWFLGFLSTVVRPSLYLWFQVRE